MKKLEYLLCFGIIFIVSCSEESIKEEVVLNNKNKIFFDLSEDYRCFSKKLNIGDTIKFHFNLSACTSNNQMYFDLVKEHSGFLLDARLQGDYVDTSFNTFFLIEEFDLDSIISNDIADSLTNLFIPPFEKRNLHVECEIIYKKDTLFLQDTLGLTGRLRHIQRVNKMYEHLFPKSENYFKHIIPPPPPPPING